jgi:TetR/AcrR family transcriptional repressor of nem operon
MYGVEPEHSARANLLEAAKALLWQRGYESMSPRAVMDAGDAGQGSFYHHFRGKADLARAALAEAAAEMTTAAGEMFGQPADGRDAVASYLSVPRDALRGCRLGRLANETSVLAEPALRTPLSGYFAHLETLFIRALERLDLPAGVAARDVAVAIVATVQGGFVLSRVHADASYMERATRAALAMFDALLSVNP